MRLGLPGLPLPGVERSLASVPTADTEREATYAGARNWSPSHIDIFGHTVDVDLPTGNLKIAVSEAGYPYHRLVLGIARSYDMQEQHMQLSYLRRYPNVDPKPHWFGNWQFGYEADAEEVWLSTLAEIQVTSGVGAGGLFQAAFAEFSRNKSSDGEFAGLLSKYGIPGRTRDEAGWSFTGNDLFLRTLRGEFRILAGHLIAETLVDDVEAALWLFDPISGAAFRIGSDYFFNVSSDGYRDVGPRMLVTKVIDALGHGIDLKSTSAAAPYKTYSLSDGSGREFDLRLDQELTFLDGLKAGRQVRCHLVSAVTDETKAVNNQFLYKYTPDGLLEEVTLPSTLGGRRIRYRYESAELPGILTAIENYRGDQVQFEYIEDPSDNDDRLNPRLKIKRIVSPEGGVIEYEYDYTRSAVVAKVSQHSAPDRMVRYEYTRDTGNTRRRYITVSETEVRRGFVLDGTGAVAPIPGNAPQRIQERTQYSSDGRFNVRKQIDPLSRENEFEYNDFNQLVRHFDADGHWTLLGYDNPPMATATQPLQYDLLLSSQENIIRTLDPAYQIIEAVQVVEVGYEYDRYDANNSNVAGDLGRFSTHRITKQDAPRKQGDPRRKQWKYSYDDVRNFNSLSPSLVASPLRNVTTISYGRRGEVTKVVDAELNAHSYVYYAHGALQDYVDPNGTRVRFTYYPEADWLYEIIDQNTKRTLINRRPDGSILSIVDASGDSVDYEYYMDGRLHKVIQHRPAVLSDPNDPTSPALTVAYANVVTEFGYAPLGSLTRLKNPKGLELVFDFDEAGRLYRWFHDVASTGTTQFIYDVAGQLLHRIDRKGQRIDYTYHNSGHVKSLQYPDWSDGTTMNSGKRVEFKKYDHRGRILTLADSEIVGDAEFVHDLAGNLVFRRDPDMFELEFAFDDDNRLTLARDLISFFELSLTPDALGRVKTLVDSTALDGSLHWDYSYQKIVGTAKRVLNLYTVGIPSIGLRSSYNYDRKNRRTHIDHAWNVNPVPTIFSQTLSYADDDLLTDIAGDDPNTFRYDGIKQLVFEAAANLTSDYDAAGNRLYRVDKGVTPSPGADVFDQTNHLKQSGQFPGNYSYDANGNIYIATTPGNAFYFDGADRLRLFKSRTHRIAYLYNHEGRLVRRTVTDAVSSSVESTSFRYLFSKPIIVERNNNPFMLLTWDPGGRLLRIRWQQNVSAGTYPNSLFCLHDGLGNIVRLVDDNQNELVSISYDPWGNTNVQDPGNLHEFWDYKNGFSDRLSANVLFGARWYSPVAGRWLSEDPSIAPSSSRFLGSNNLCTYVLNNPINFFDSSGLQEEPLSVVMRLPHGFKFKILGFGWEAEVAVAGGPRGLYFEESLGLGPLQGEATGGWWDREGFFEAEGGVGPAGRGYVGQRWHWARGEVTERSMIGKLFSAGVAAFGLGLGLEIYTKGRFVDSVVARAKGYSYPQMLEIEAQIGIWQFTYEKALKD